MRRLLLSVALVVALGACLEPLPEDATGEMIYDHSCAGCHGSYLEGSTGPSLGLGAPSSDESRDYFVQTVTNGRSRMPAFDDALTDEQIDRVVTYIMEQQGR